MADDAQKLEPEVRHAFPPEPSDRWDIARERLAQYDRDGIAVDLDDALERFDAALEAAIKAKA
jgi:hypothetical protein